MIKATFFTSSFYINNRQFDISDNVVNMNDTMYGFYVLKEKFKERQIDLSTQDINLPDESEFIIYNEMPGIKDINPNMNNYLLMFESKVVRPDNWNTGNHSYFRKIFTWDDELVDGEKYIKLNYPHKIPEEMDYQIDKKEKLCVMIASHKIFERPNELYTERIKAIRWFEQNHPEDFDLYGHGWDSYWFKGNLAILNRSHLLTKLLRPKYPSFKYPAPSREVLPKYKFAICYENARDVAGYITEKIFNCFFSGCVPVYWGAPNVTDYIPEETFIDKRKFNSFEEIYDFLKTMPDEQYLRYLASIRNFIKSPKIYPFSADSFAHTIIREIMKKDN